MTPERRSHVALEPQAHPEVITTVQTHPLKGGGGRQLTFISQ